MPRRKKGPLGKDTRNLRCKKKKQQQQEQEDLLQSLSTPVDVSLLKRRSNPKDSTQKLLLVSENIIIEAASAQKLNQDSPGSNKDFIGSNTSKIKAKKYYFLQQSKVVQVLHYL